MTLSRIGTVKSVLLGPGGVGKTTLALTCLEQRFIPASYTVYMTAHILTVNADDVEIELQIFDFAGQQQFKAMGLNPGLLEGTQSAALIFDVTELDETLDHLPHWIADLPETVPKILVGNKIDLLPSLDARFDLYEEIRPLMEKYHFEEFLFTSAKADLRSVNKLFTKLAALAVVPHPLPLTP
ncbi:MAG: Rab family GTPase [Candidatus Hodarchaeales archaeon]|jgi:small GTP-binding protein